MIPAQDISPSRGTREGVGGWETQQSEESGKRGARALVAFASILSGCSSLLGTIDAAAVDAGRDAGMRIEDGGHDAGIDAGMLDAGAIDAGTIDAGAIDAGACRGVIETFPIQPASHVASCSPITYSTMPPTSGPHYPMWAAFRGYSSRVPYGFLVHAMEHGAVVVYYDCPEGCDADLIALRAFLDARPADPLCVDPIRHRVIIAPDPMLDVRFAAAAWGASLRADCFDLEALGTFLDDHYARAPENFCNDGVAAFPDPCAP